MKNNSEIYFGSEKYISSKQTAVLTDYTSDYIGQLCRLGKIKCQRSGRDWLVSEQSILNYKNRLSRQDEPKHTFDFGYLIRPLIFTAIFMAVITGLILNLDAISKLALPSLPEISFSLPRITFPTPNPLAPFPLLKGEERLGKVLKTAKTNYFAIASATWELGSQVKENFAALSLPSFSFSLPKISLPEFPKITFPKLPDFSFAKLALPSLPDFSLPRITFPELPEFSLPDVSLSKLSLPSIPSFPPLPSLPSFSFSFSLPEIPKIALPKLSFSFPKIYIPKISLPQIEIPEIRLPKMFLAALPTTMPFTWEDSKLAVLDIKNRFLENLFLWKDYLASWGGDVKTIAQDFLSTKPQTAEAPPPDLLKEGSKVITFESGSPDLSQPSPSKGEELSLTSPPLQGGEGVVSGILSRLSALENKILGVRDVSTLDQKLSALNDSILLQVRNSLALIERRLPSNQVQNPVVFLTASIPGPSYNSPPQTGSGVSASFGDFSAGISTGGNLTASGNIVLGSDNKTAEITSSAWRITSAGAASGFTSLSTGSLSASTFNTSGLLTAGGFIATASSTVVGDFTNQNATTTGYLAVTGSATSTFSNGIKLTGGCFLLLDGTCAGAGSGGITSLGGLTGATQTFSANGPLAIVSSGTVHTFNASSSPFFGSIFATSTIRFSALTSGLLAVDGSGTLSASSTINVNQGGTGSTTPLGGILIGNGLGAISSASINSPLAFAAGALTCTNCLNTATANGPLAITSSGSTYTFNASSSPSLGFLNATSTASSWFSSFLGVGTTSPASLLSVHGNALISGTTTIGNLIATSTLKVGGVTGSSLFVGANGNVGIGTTSPAQLLSVSGNGYLTGGLGIGQTETTAGNITGTGRLSITSTTATSTFSTGGLTVGTSQFVVQQTSGNVGIGTTSPASIFSVQGNGLISGTLTSGNINATNTLAVASSSPAQALSITGSGFFTGGLGVNQSTTTSGVIEAAGLILSRTAFANTGSATSTFSGGIQILGTGNVCLPNGTCIGAAGGSGITSLGGLTGATQTFSANGPLAIVSSGTVHTFNASSSPFFGSIFATSTLTTSAATPFIFQVSSTSTIPINKIYAWSIATSTTAVPLLTFNTNGPRATTTIPATVGLSVGGGALEYDSSSGVTSFDSANTGPMAFDTDAGIVSWIDLPSSTTTANIVNSYSAMIDSTAILTIYGTTTTAGNILYGSVGIGTTSPDRSSLVVGWNNSRVEISNGGLCVDNDGGCNASTTGRISSVTSTVGATDVAEMYSSTQSLEAGEIVMVSGGSFVERAAKKNMNKVIGVISTDPGLTLGLGPDATTTNGYPVALAGRVPVKVSLENGPIKIGDRITISSKAGVGMRATTSGVAIGIALEDFTNANDTNGGTNATNTGKILVFVNLGYHKLDDNIHQLAEGETGWFVDQTSGKIKARSILSASGLWSIDENGKLIVQEVQTKKLCLEDVCITKTELRALLQNAGLLANPNSTPSVIPPADTTPPTITINGNNPAVINIGAAFADLGVTITDNLDQNLGYTASLDGGPALPQGAGLTIDTSTTTTHAILYTATDSAGNTASSTRTVNVVSTP